MKDLVKAELLKLIGDFDCYLESPKDKSLAHYATPLAFSLAKEFKKAPKIIADEIVAKAANSEIFTLSSLNGYINIHLKESYLNSLASESLKQREQKSILNPNAENILLEYVSANPTGPLHIGHVRGAVYGDSLARVGRYLGHKITTEYFINDAGNQIELLGTSILLAGQKNILNKDVEYLQNCYRGEYIDELATKAVKQFGKEILYEIDNDEVVKKISLWGKDEMLKVIKKNLFDANITIENWVSEASLYDELQPTLEKLKQNGAIYEKDGALYISSSKVGDEKDRVVIRDDKRPTYLAGDIVYHYNKFKRGYDHYINIWGADHHGYILRLKAAIRFLGYDDERLEVILAQMVSLLKNGESFKMSKRAGNFILMGDVLDEIGSDALRFIFISKKCDTPLEFDVEELKKEDSSNPIFYVNYAHARVHQLFKRAQKSFDDVASYEIKELNSDAKALLFEALRLDEVLDDAFRQRQLQKITDYLVALSAKFHKFYNENRVLGSKDEKSYLKLFAVVAVTIKKALSLVGIEAKEKMAD